MKTRTITELLQILIKHIQNDYKYNTQSFLRGICLIISSLYRRSIITIKEREKFLKFIKENRPKEGSKFYRKSQRNSFYYFKPGAWNIRLKYLKYLLNEEISKI